MDIDKPIITISLEKPTEDDVNRIYEIFTSEGTERFLTDSFKLLQSKTGVSMLLSNSLNKSNNIRCVARDVGFLRLINAKIERPSTLTGKDYAVEDTVGICHIAYNKQYSNTVNIFYVIDAKYRARGIGTWALREITRYIKEELFVIDSIDNIEFKGCVQDQMTVSRIEIVIADGNIASMRIAEKNGFEPEGIARKAAKVNGEFTDCTVYSLIPDEPIKLQFRSEPTDTKIQLQIPKVEEPQPQQEPQQPIQQESQPTQQQPIQQEPQPTQTQQPKQSKPTQTKIEGLNSRLDKALQVLDSMEQQTERSIQQANQHTKILNNFNEIVKQAVKYSEKAEKSVILDKLNDMVKEDTSENVENETMPETLGDLLSNMMNEVKEETQKNQSSDIEQISTKSTISESPCKVVNTVVDIEEPQPQPQPTQQPQQSQPQPTQQPQQSQPQPTQQPQQSQPQPTQQSQPQPKPQVKITLKGLTNNSIKGKRD